MNKIDELIQELCPNGISITRLGDVASYSKARVASDSLDGGNFVGVDNLLADKGGKAIAKYTPNTTNIAAYEVGDILLGNIRPYLKKVWLATNNGGCSGDVLAIRIFAEHRSTLLAEFLYYVLSSDAFFAYDMQHSKGAKMPRGDKVSILNYQFAIPPLEVQKEIVNILDKFTQLEAELSAELEARRRQYEFYRNQLVGKHVFYSTNWVTLESVMSIKTGTKPSVIEKTPEGVPYINAGNEPSGYTNDKNAKGGVITIPSRGQGSAGYVGYQEQDFWCGPLCYKVGSTTNRILNKFAYYYLKNIQSKIVELRKIGSIPAVNKTDLGKVLIPTPPIFEQEKIINILDNFDKLVNDISSGLPAEITARRKQYEYYRTKLLTFQELK